MRLILAIMICSALSAAVAFAQMGTTAPAPAKRTVFGHDIEENTLYYVMATGTPRDSLVKLEVCSTNQGSSTSYWSFALDKRDERPDLANLWMNIPGTAARVRFTNPSPRFFIWTSKESIIRLRAARLKIKKDFRTIGLDPKNGHGHFFKESVASQVGQFAPDSLPNAYAYVLPGPLKPGEYVIALGPQGPAVDFAIDKAGSK